MVYDGDFILSNSMSYGRPYIVKIEGAIHDGWLLLRIKNKTLINQDYLYYILNSDGTKKQYENLATGGVVKNLNSKLVRGVKIPLAPLEIQKEIVAKIEGDQKIISNLQAEIESNEQKIKDKIASVWGE